MILTPYSLSQVAQGTDPLENPSGVITNYGLLSTGVRTEPDENTYLQMPFNPGGPTADYDYGHHFLFQGHENSGSLAYVTRINLDIQDPAHRITLLTPVGDDGLTHFNSIDGSSFDPFAGTLLFTQEAGTNGGVIQSTIAWPPTISTLDGIIGKGGFEGIHPDDRGNLLILEDAGGSSVNVIQGETTSPKTARQPNSFVFRFVPTDRTNLLSGGKLQALQVMIDGVPLTFNAADPVGDVFAAAQVKLHTVGQTWPARWVTVHDTAVDGTASFSANAAAKAASATPFKRPENGVFQPASGFRRFFFDTTGDTDSTSGVQPELAQRGAYGAIFVLSGLSATGNNAFIGAFFLGDAAHNSFDNLTFADEITLLATEDRGDTLHDQLNALDSVWAFTVVGRINTRRFIALGRDAVSAPTGEEDNEPTGLHVSEGAGDFLHMQGRPLNPVRARAFVTQQHGLNRTFEIDLGRR
ncbi:MAG TPA: alkaline phosphatase PhoX [Polyangia bacterium]|nr:alkaline phosphatase PhoX [Polyangia bacterium]